MSRKTLLVLAASTYQVPVIERARAMGVRVISADNRPENPGHRISDAAFNIDTTDVGAILALARQERIDGILAAATDVALATASYVGEAMGLVAPPRKAAEVLCDKPAFREFQRREGLPFPQFRSIAPDADFSPSPGETWVLKPDRSSGSKGIRIVTGPREGAEQLAEARGHAKGGVVVAERFLPGSQGTVEGVLQDGRLAGFLVTDRITAPQPFVATHGHRTPSRIGEAALRSLVKQIEHVAGALGLGSGPLDCDFVAHDNDATLIEITPRMGGNAMMRLVEAGAGFAFIDYAVAHALGEAPSLAEPWRIRPTGVQLLGVMNAGRLSFNQAAADELRREPWMIDLAFDCGPGTSVEPFTDGRRRVGEALFRGASRDEIDVRADEILTRLDVRAS